MIGPRFANYLQGDRHSAIVEPHGDRNRRETEQINEPRPAAQLIERFGVENTRARVAFGNRGRADCKRRKYNRLGILKDLADKIRNESRARRYTGRKRYIVDCEPLR